MAIAVLLVMASVVSAALYSNTGTVTNVKICLDGTTPYCLFKHTNETYWYNAGSLLPSAAEFEQTKEICSMAKAAQLSGRIVTTRHTSYGTYCGHTYTRRLWTGDTGAGIELQ